MEITKTFYFDSAHFLPNLPPLHKCKKLHGHTFKIDITVRGGINEKEGWVMDFQEIKNAMKPVIEILDHNLLNNIEGLENPTSENIAKFIWEKIKTKIPSLCKIEVYETPFSKCTYRGEKNKLNDTQIPSLSENYLQYSKTEKSKNYKTGIRIGKEGMHFNFAHFLIYDNGKRDRIHGHSYYCELEIYASLDKNGVIADFRIIKEKLKEIVSRLNQCILIPEKNRNLKIKKNGFKLTLVLDDETIEFPLGDCYILPIENTSTELLSKYICDEICNAITASFPLIIPCYLKITLTEGIEMQGAICEKELI